MPKLISSMEILRIHQQLLPHLYRVGLFAFVNKKTSARGLADERVEASAYQLPENLQLSNWIMLFLLKKRAQEQVCEKVLNLHNLM